MSQRLIPTGERSGLRTHTADVQRFIVRAEEKLTALWPHLQPDRSANSGQHVQCRMAYAWPFFTSSNS